jgi:hypothetical protein
MSLVWFQLQPIKDFFLSESGIANKSCPRLHSPAHTQSNVKEDPKQKLTNTYLKNN